MTSLKELKANRNCRFLCITFKWLDQGCIEGWPSWIVLRGETPMEHEWIGSSLLISLLQVVCITNTNFWKLRIPGMAFHSRCSVVLKVLLLVSWHFLPSFLMPSGPKRPEPYLPTFISASTNSKKSFPQTWKTMELEPLEEGRWTRRQIEHYSSFLWD